MRFPRCGEISLNGEIETFMIIDVSTLTSLRSTGLLKNPGSSNQTFKKSFYHEKMQCRTPKEGKWILKQTFSECENKKKKKMLTCCCNVS